MIDLHTHTLFSDGELLPSELARRAEVKGYTAIALTDHVDSSNIDFVLPRIVKVAKSLNKFWKIRVIPGVEITHAPIQEIKNLVRFARKNGAKVIIVHGETISEPVIPGTNREAIKSGCDILAHPGNISRQDAALAKSKGVCLELTTRKSHSMTNRHVFKMAKSVGARLILNNDAHREDDLLSGPKAMRLLRNIGLSNFEIKKVFKNSEELAGGAGYNPASER